APALADGITVEDGTTADKVLVYEQTGNIIVHPLSSRGPLQHRRDYRCISRQHPSRRESPCASP
ncbi:hypothetical protein, partial [Microbacterium sp. K19]|uniref:hypothetical protein n=1 Tax=Microbacterium sp. K19 TaxID=2305449 RepID=UPI00197B166C